MDAEPTAPLTELFTESDMPEPRALRFAGGIAVAFAHRSPTKDTPNEDSLGLLDAGERGSVLLLADGAGGHADGALASKLAVTALRDSVLAALAQERDIRDGILDGFELANRAVAQGTHGGVTTMIAAELRDGHARIYHAGDSMAVLTGLRGRIKHCSTAHSPTGYAVEAGVLDETSALHHRDRHVISNALGVEGMHIEIGPALQLATQDTLVLASDGLFDNLTVPEIVARARGGSAREAVNDLVTLCRERMAGIGGARAPSKPDDLSVLLWRPKARHGDRAVPPRLSAPLRSR
ncbi:MAG: hypothetical protein DHS20C15_26560 [Planctomycetota bacterium]|nr:MAG: hypothetical protein DHS20C15_26560 [Planctomycetota bacterium]